MCTLVHMCVCVCVCECACVRDVLGAGVDLGFSVLTLEALSPLLSLASVSSHTFVFIC